jgi:hypothetical protein
MRLLSIASLGFGLLAQAHADGIVHIADGDCAGLGAALGAGSGGRTTVVLARGGHYTCSIEVARGDFVMDGQGAALETDVCPSELLTVDAGAKLLMTNLSVRSPSCSPIGHPPRQIYNLGLLDIDSANIAVAQVVNGGTMSFRNVTWSGGVDNQGAFQVEQSTSLNGGISNDGNAQLLLSNTLFTNDGGYSECAVVGQGAVRSLGGNALSSACAFAVAADTRWSSPPALDELKDNGGLVATRALPSNSSLRGKGVAKYCAATDARGKVRPAGACDVGAYEIEGGGERVEAGGMNGFYFDRKADGHYVTIQRLDDELVLVTWTTFDRDGHQAWIYGVGAAHGRAIHVDMSQNTGGRLQPGGPASGSHVVPWGTVDITMNGCSGGTFAYRSELAAFGNGQFPLDRLASFADVGCVD